MRPLLGKDDIQGRRCHILASLDAVVAVHQDFRFNDRHDAGFLAQGRVSGKRMGIRAQAVFTGNTIADMNNCAPLRELRAEPRVFCKAISQSVEALSDGFAGETGQCFSTRIDLDAGDHAQITEILRKRHAVAGALTNCFVKQDDATDIVGHATEFRSFTFTRNSPDFRCCVLYVGIRTRLEASIRCIWGRARISNISPGFAGRLGTSQYRKNRHVGWPAQLNRTKIVVFNPDGG